MKLSEKAKQAKREYHRQWRANNPGYDKAWRDKNPDKVKQHQITKWEKKAKAMQDNNDTVKVSVTKRQGLKVCIQCGEFFQPIRITGKYCSDKCRVNYNRRK